MHNIDYKISLFFQFFMTIIDFECIYWSDDILQNGWRDLAKYRGMNVNLQTTSGPPWTSWFPEVPWGLDLMATSSRQPRPPIWAHCIQQWSSHFWDPTFQSGHWSWTRGYLPIFTMKIYCVVVVLKNARIVTVLDYGLSSWCQFCHNESPGATDDDQVPSWRISVFSGAIT